MQAATIQSAPRLFMCGWTACSDDGCIDLYLTRLLNGCLRIVRPSVGCERSAAEGPTCTRARLDPLSKLEQYGLCKFQPTASRRRSVCVALSARRFFVRRQAKGCRMLGCTGGEVYYERMPDCGCVVGKGTPGATATILRLWAPHMMTIIFGAATSCATTPI